MTFSELVLTRRSIRKYRPDPISEETVRQWLSWGHAAPSGGNLCPWEFIILRREAGKRAAVDATFCGNQENGAAHQEWLMTAPVLLAVCADEARIQARYGKTSIWKSLAYLDCSACIENLLLGAVELGLGSCYVSGFRETPMRQALRLPAHVRPIALLPLGVPDMTGHARPRPALEDHMYAEAYGCALI